ncbi:MAG TPA: TIGR02302 family protein [Kiloniellales bacterium]|nr:TIGR02302 family protein [Kiloniellales bacterium]
MVWTLLWFLWAGLRHFSWPTREQALQRIEAASGLPHRPLAAAYDRPALGNRDRQAMQLFYLHRDRARRQLSRLKSAPPRPVMAGADPLALLAGAALLLVVGLVVGGGELRGRLWSALNPSLEASAGSLPPSLDAWLDPPDYTGAAPIYLSQTAPEQKVRVPAGSRLIAQVQGGGAEPSITLAEATTPFTEAAQGLWKIEMEVTAGSELQIFQGGQTIGHWQLEVVPDLAPSAAFPNPPGESERQALVIPYQAGDDYGLIDLKLEIRRADEAGEPPLSIDLAELNGSRKEINGEAYKDLTAHLWAGFVVELTLIATDETGQEGRSATERMVLPERIFTHPVARQLVELRRRLTLDPEERLPIVRALEELLAVPADYGNDSVVALGMAAAAGRLLHERASEAVPGAQELLWLSALRLEDGDVSLMARSLREIEERLRKALESDASDEEIQALIDELEQAMQQYMQALTEEMQKRLQEGQEFQPLPEGAMPMEMRDLSEMLDQMRQLSQSGAREEAQRMLDELQRMMENLQANPFAMMPNEQMQQALDQMREMEGLLRDQQELLDQSMREQQRQQGWNQPQMNSDEPGQQPMQGQAQAQEQLRRRLGELMRDLANQMGEIPDNLGRAEQAMRDATGQLQENNPGGAIPPQTEAIDQLQQGMQEMAQQFLEQFGPTQGVGQGRTGIRPGESLDPLGRRSGDGATDAVEQIDIPEAGELTRARRILDELRRRRGEPERPIIERDYIDRLLEQF